MNQENRSPAAGGRPDKDGPRLVEVEGSMARSADGFGLSVRIFLSPDLFWFRGHFPVQPVVPGVAQLFWARHYAEALLGERLRLARVRQMKFTVAALPGETLLLELEAQRAADGFAVRVAYSVLRGGAQVPASQGKITLCPRDSGRSS